MKIADLRGGLLSAAVAKVAGLAYRTRTVGAVVEGRTCAHSSELIVCEVMGREYNPATLWAHGGPLIAEHQVFIDPPHDVHVNGGPNAGWHKHHQWSATVSARVRTWHNGPGDPAATLGGRVGRGWGSSPLIAVCRAVVASYCGEEIEI